ncbi:hypothetical protein PQR06_15145 [Paraburkholderia graminis]
MQSRGDHAQTPSHLRFHAQRGIVVSHHVATREVGKTALDIELFSLGVLVLFPDLRNRPRHPVDPQFRFFERAAQTQRDSGRAIAQLIENAASRLGLAQRNATLLGLRARFIDAPLCVGLVRLLAVRARLQSSFEFGGTRFRRADSRTDRFGKEDFPRHDEPAIAERREALAQRMDVRRSRQLAQRAHQLGGFGAHGNDTKPESVQELETGIARPQLAEELENAEVALMDIRVVEQHHRAFGQLVAPRFKIVADRLVSMKPVDMQKIDAAIGEMIDGLVERAAHQFGERSVMFVVKAAQVIVDLVAIVSGVLVALPCIDRKTPGSQSLPDHRLAEGRIRHAVVRAEFNQHTRLACRHDPERERYMRPPCARLSDQMRCRENWIKFRRHQCAQRRLQVKRRNGFYVHNGERR